MACIVVVVVVIGGEKGLEKIDLPFQSHAIK